MNQRQLRIRNRQRVVMGGGFGVVVILTATACIFDRSDYQGGGRVDRGATAQTSDPGPTSSVDVDTGAVPTDPQDSGLPDVNLGGD
ncbi:MAG: hypothetical protein KF819_06810 [Labilithrix sp.]|nr:hypothetical protein [Labilithrix sp.]